MARSPSFEEATTSAVNWHLEQMNTAIPAIVIRVISDLQGSQIDVQPSINFKGYDGTTQERSTILNVPVVFPCSSTSAITFPLNPGDPVLLIFSQRGLDAWKSGNGYPSTPTDYRMHAVQDCFAIPCPMPTSRSVNSQSNRKWPHSTRDMVLAHNLGTGFEVELRLTEAGKLQINTDLAVEINANEGSVNIPVTNWEGTIIHAGGSIISNGVTLHTHTHNQLPDSRGDTEQPTLPPNAG